MRALVVTGEYGAGKSAIAAEVQHQMEDLGVRTAAIDLDWFGWVGPGLTPEEHRDLLRRNLSAIVDNFAIFGVERVVVARALRGVEDRALVLDAFAGAPVDVVLLKVGHDEAVGRIRARDQGAELAELLNDARAVAADVAGAGVEDFCVDNGAQRRLEDVAKEILQRADWIEQSKASPTVDAGEG
jgi:hypothetical protein